MGKSSRKVMQDEKEYGICWDFIWISMCFGAMGDDFQRFLASANGATIAWYIFTIIITAFQLIYIYFDFFGTQARTIVRIASWIFLALELGVGLLLSFLIYSALPSTFLLISLSFLAFINSLKNWMFARRASNEED